MERQLYTIYDQVAEQTFGPIMVLPNDAVARRTFQDALFGEGSHMSSHPGDYALYHIGTINLVTGRITPVQHEVPIKAAPLIKGDVLIELATNREAANG